MRVPLEVYSVVSFDSLTCRECELWLLLVWIMAAPADLAVPRLRVRRLTAHACLPKRSTPLSAGFDLASAVDLVIPAHGKALVKTDIALALPSGCYGRIAPRSGLAWKSHIDIGAGVIDADYRGNVGVVMYNLSSKAFEVVRGMRVAQLILERYEWRAVVQEVADLDQTARGGDGFGSTGLKAQAPASGVDEVKEVNSD